MNDYEAKLNCSAANPCMPVDYKEPTMLENLESERDHTIDHLSNLVKKINMLRSDPTLEDKVKLFNRY